jgi:hypothetical protein
LALAQPESFIGAEEEEFVAQDGAAQISTELVLRESRALNTETVVEESVGIQCPIPQEFIGRAMELIGSRLGAALLDSVTLWA